MACVDASVWDEDWPDKVLASIPAQSTPECPVPRQGSLWLSNSTHRRASVLWASGGRVCLSYDETRIQARKVHCLVDFVRLYTEAR